MTRPRLFLALPLDQEQRSWLRRLREELQPALPFQKWVHTDDLHITLKFLGETETVAVSAISSLMRGLAAASSPLALSLQRFGTFGKPSAPSILWIGVGGDMDALRHLHAQSEKAMESAGFAPDNRSYSPHLTVARNYAGAAAFSKAGLASAEQMLAAHSTGMHWTVEQIILYRSHLGRTPMYEAVDRFPLG
ncbi:RNA 2',3'-cyclic phosphodiesterase [Paenibacillus piri]|uniref:RNA 2',3'-cyclic phosphodiesterase n=1 Tax=Paenibacillus piri TaxID=2547395 RepID=A0A4R5KWT6_9BACL|nr:RNA 2',3'-cyclic phosphodiesterase [Paenibacillus piri]TDG00502.1 RNA 2',3'-cyclic phosphodiesterase [Paenibacillus piri]